MRVIIVGAGVVGTTSALFLAERGHSVTVVDAAPGVATGASAVNAGLLVPGDSTVWGNPAAVRMLATAMLPGGHSFIKVRPGAGLRLIPWGLQFLRECFPSAEARNVRDTYALSAYSYEQLEALLQRHPIDFSHERNGMMFLFASARDRADGARAREVLRDAGEPFRELDGDDLVALDPAFATAAADGASGLYSVRSGHGDAEAFTRGVAAAAQQLGVEFRLGATVQRVWIYSKQVRGVVLADGEQLDADTVVLAAGSRTANLARDAAAAVPIIPSKGYSASVPIVNSAAVPRIGGVDERTHVAFSRMGDSLRISSTAEFVGEDMSSRDSDYDDIRTTADRLFPGALDWANAVYNTGARPATPSGVPIIGWARTAGLAINSGHGHLGWTQAAGSAALLADILDNRTPQIPDTPYRP